MNKTEYENRELKKENSLLKESLRNTQIVLKGLNQEFKDYKKEVKIVITKLQNMKKNDTQTDTTR